MNACGHPTDRYVSSKLALHTGPRDIGVWLQACRDADLYCGNELAIAVAVATFGANTNQDLAPTVSPLTAVPRFLRPRRRHLADCQLNGLEGLISRDNSSGTSGAFMDEKGGGAFSMASAAIYYTFISGANCNSFSCEQLQPLFELVTFLYPGTQLIFFS